MKHDPAPSAVAAAVTIEWSIYACRGRPVDACPPLCASNKQSVFCLYSLGGAANWLGLTLGASYTDRHLPFSCSSCSNRAMWCKFMLAATICLFCSDASISWKSAEMHKTFVFVDNCCCDWWWCYIVQWCANSCISSHWPARTIGAILAPTSGRCDLCRWL